MTASVIRAHAASLPLPDGCVDLIVTSPPYFGLRSYTDGGEHYDGQIGSEATPQEWLAAMVECTREMMRVLKPEGSIFINIGDKYAAGHGGSSTEGKGITIRKRSSFAANPRERPDLPDPPASWSMRDVTGRNVVPGTTPKSLMGLPWRYALACTDQLGLILRAEIIWAKPNGLPESVTDRVRRAHEQVFHFTRQPRYYSAVDEIREPHIDPRTGSNGHARDFHTEQLSRKWNPSQNAYNPLGKLPGSVWPIPSQPLQVPARLGVDHFAAFPMELPRRCILGWSPPGVCTGCGQGRHPTVDRDVPATYKRYAIKGHSDPRADGHARMFFDSHQDTRRTITGYVCACPEPSAPTRPAIVLDPFSGTGTTILVASVLGRRGIGVDLSADYCRLAQWRTTDPGERARALQVPKPPPIPDGQEALWP